MSKKNRKVDSKEVGLEVGLILFKYFLNTEYLHYGLFNNGLATEVQNLAQAQQNYAQFLLSNIPQGVKSILDVGCGSGRFAQELLKAGYQVDCVSPGTILTEHARKLVGDKAQIFNCKYEDMQTDKKYDLILFSESFQYIDIDASFTNSLKYLNPQGYMMVCDFFKTDPENKSMLGGGHDYNRFLEVQKKYPVKILKEQDITRETAPTIDLVNKLSLEVIHPIFKLLMLLLEDRFAWVAKFVQWKYKKKLEKMERKHFKGERNGANFQLYKKYMFYLYQAN